MDLFCLWSSLAFHLLYDFGPKNLFYFSPGGWFVGAWFGFLEWPYYCGMQSLFMGFVVSRGSHCMFYVTACQSGCSFVHGLLGPHHHLMLHSSPNKPGSKTFKIRDTSDIEVLIKGSSKWCSIAYTYSVWVRSLTSPSSS
ncbi:hypothetical protein HID58_080297 [Brassica napus]|uniref:Uncharacterized protein n=1 Tax=Brassica napus TaxID=3708 RepID=A0ABQ7Y4K3_BRANA|nr:hypothetical protein HID58_080297 [Brassica napus]